MCVYEYECVRICIQGCVCVWVCVCICVNECMRVYVCREDGRILSMVFEKVSINRKINVCNGCYIFQSWRSRFGCVVMF